MLVYQRVGTPNKCVEKMRHSESLMGTVTFNVEGLVTFGVLASLSIQKVLTLWPEGSMNCLQAS
jgi:hypothetical protein